MSVPGNERGELNELGKRPVYSSFTVNLMMHTFYCHIWLKANILQLRSDCTVPSQAHGIKRLCCTKFYPPEPGVLGGLSTRPLDLAGFGWLSAVASTKLSLTLGSHPNPTIGGA